MATVELRQVWLSLPTDPTPLPLLFRGGRAFTDEQPGEVRRYAGGRLRPVTRAGSSRGVELTVGVTATEHATLLGWRGQTVLYRDGLGNKLYCVYFTTPWVASRDGRTRDVTLRLLEVSYSEAV